MISPYTITMICPGNRLHGTGRNISCTRHVTVEVKRHILGRGAAQGSHSPGPCSGTCGRRSGRTPSSPGCALRQRHAAWTALPARQGTAVGECLAKSPMSVSYDAPRKPEKRPTWRRFGNPRAKLGLIRVCCEAIGSTMILFFGFFSGLPHNCQT